MNDEDDGLGEIAWEGSSTGWMAMAAYFERTFCKECSACFRTGLALRLVGCGGKCVCGPFSVAGTCESSGLVCSVRCGPLCLAFLRKEQS